MKGEYIIMIILIALFAMGIVFVLYKYCRTIPRAKIILITSYFNSPHDQRQREIDECLVRNVKNPWIDKIYLLNDRYYPLDFILDHKNKIEQVVMVEGYKKNRLLYSSAIHFANTHLSGKDICILSNLDIYFDDSLNMLRAYNLDRKFLALSRYENNILVDEKDSQDTWIFQCPFLTEMMDHRDLEFGFGVPGCDNRIARIALDHGYNVVNPSRTIRTHHLHESKHRTYSGADRIHGEYHFIAPTRL